jgi:hypothetical protein
MPSCSDPDSKILNAKVQMTNQIQSSNVKNILEFLKFDIHLTFACLPVGRDFELGTLIFLKGSSDQPLISFEIFLLGLLDDLFG